MAAATAVLRSGWLTTGERTQCFESEFKTYAGASFAQALNSGTAALHLALVALGIGPGDEVITTPLTFCATVTVILDVAATPGLAEIGSNLNIAPESVFHSFAPRPGLKLPPPGRALP